MEATRVFRVLDRDYPHALRELPSPPDPVCVAGELLGGPAAAIVGTREPTAQAASYAYELAHRLAQAGVTVWSGGALGIDAAAHRGALDAGGVTVAVTGTGLRHCYPPEHGPLYDRIVAQGGAVVSPFPLDHPAMLFTFHQRNEVLAALTQATVVVQAPLKSGARSTARHARRLGRPLFVTPSAPWEAQAAGNLAELRLGARLLADEDDLFRLLGVRAPLPSRLVAAPVRQDRATSSTSTEHELGTRQERHLAPLAIADDPLNESAPLRDPPIISALSPVCQAVFRATSHVARHLDDLCAETGLRAAFVQEALLTLTLEAVLVEGPAGRFRRATVRKD